MKKVFISVPMKGRTKEEIEKSISKMQRIARETFDGDVVFVNTEVKEKCPYNNEKEAIWYLAKSIEIMSQCDVVVVPSDMYNYRGCYIESDVAYRYGLEVLSLDAKYVCPDVYEKQHCNSYTDVSYENRNDPCN